LVLVSVHILSTLHTNTTVGVEDFAHDSPILCSGFDPSFISPQNIAKHSLCTLLDIPTPKYTPTLVPHMHDITVQQEADDADVPVGLRILHTPGHTPDELAVWDEEERMLYVGDTLYEFAAIIFPSEGDIVDWWRSVEDMLRLVQTHNSKDGLAPVQISAGHITAAQEAESVLLGAREFMRDVLKGTELAYKQETRRDEQFLWYKQESGRFRLGAPKRLIEDAKQKLVL
jgi:glyoxylase-like metal-dependent hydrolase (beta-lactamase superfamily II)